MAIEGASRQPSPNGRSPWWVAAAGGGGGIMAAILQDHALGWAIVVAFVAWLIHNIAIAWIRRAAGAETTADRTAATERRHCQQVDGVNVAGNRQRHRTG